MAQIRRLTKQGREEFKAWLEQGAPGAAPVRLLTDHGSSEDIEGRAQVAKRSFDTRLELGEYLVDQLAGLPQGAIPFDEGLWDWLSLFYIDELLPADASGKRDVKEIVRYALELRNRKWSRHIVRVSWMAVKEHAQAARVLLSVPLSKHTDVMEQIGGQQEAFGVRCVVEVADRLYFDEGTGRLKRGAQGKKAGSPRRLRAFLGQFRRTFDPPSMRADQLLECLPREFDRWFKEPQPAKASSLDAAIDARNLN